MGSPPIEWGLYTDSVLTFGVIISLADSGTRAVVVTQTSDHYDWNEFEEVDSIGEF